MWAASTGKRDTGTAAPLLEVEPDETNSAMSWLNGARDAHCGDAARPGGRRVRLARGSHRRASVDRERRADCHVVRRRGVLVQLADIGAAFHRRWSGRVDVSLALGQRGDGE